MVISTARLAPNAISVARSRVSVAQASDALSALVNLAYLLGALAGPLLGGSLVELCGFRWASTALGGALLVLSLALIPCLMDAARRPTAAVAKATNALLADELLANQALGSGGPWDQAAGEVVVAPAASPAARPVDGVRPRGDE